MDTASQRKLSVAWSWLALGVFAVSLVPAAILVSGYLPFVRLGAEVIKVAFALHSTLAMPAWLFGMACVAVTSAIGRGGLWGWGCWWLALVGSLALLLSPLASGKLVAIPYLPLYDNAIFLGGLATFALGSAATMARGLVRLRHFASGSPAMIALSWLLPTSVACLAFALTVAGEADSLVAADLSLYGVAQSLQLFYGLVLMAAWLAVAEDVVADIAAYRRALHGMFGLAAFSVAAAIVGTAVTPGSVELREWLSWLARWGAWPAPVLLAIVLAQRMSSRRAVRDAKMACLGLAISALLFTLGALFALMRDGSEPAPEQLHGAMGALAVACLLWWERLVTGRTGGSLSRWAAAYGVGMLFFVIALGTAQLNRGSALANFAMAMAVLAAIAAIACAWAYGVTALAGRFATAAVRVPRRDMRPWAITVTLVLVIGGGALLSSTPRSERGFSPREHAAAKLKADVDIRFQQGVVMLHAKQYEHALTAFHRVLQIAPDMPEAHVNMGFALLGLKRYKEASDFFDSATQLRPGQTNAYYGLAVAQEGMGNVREAVEAMEAYVHLAKPDDPFLTKAKAAIWEWRAALDKDGKPAP